MVPAGIYAASWYFPTAGQTKYEIIFSFRQPTPATIQLLTGAVPGN